MANQETDIQRRILLALAGVGTMFRNNCGMYKTKEGSYIRYGVANPGGSDLIGWTPVKITKDMVGGTVAVFTAIEVKVPPWKRPRDKHEHQQRHFIEVIKNAGGIAGFATNDNEALWIVRSQI